MDLTAEQIIKLRSIGFIDELQLDKILEWFIDKHGLYPELIIDGYRNNYEEIPINIVETCWYRVYIWETGKPKPDICGDYSAGKLMDVYKVAIEVMIDIVINK